MAIDEAAKALFQRCASEVDEESYRLIGPPQVGEQLCRMRSMQSLQRFHFDQKSAFYKDVDPKCRLEPQPITFDVDPSRASWPAKTTSYTASNNPACQCAGTNTCRSARLLTTRPRLDLHR